MWLPPALLLLSLPGCFSIQGPKVTRGLEGGSLTVECRYTPGWETNRKWWCRGANWRDCRVLIQTTPGQHTVQGPRLSISDNQRDRVISVTMWDLRPDDQDTYWCGIKRLGTDRGAPVRVIVVGSENLSSWTTANSSGVSSGSRIRNYYLLLVFVKVPLLLGVVGAILWLKGPPRAPEEQRELPIQTNLSYDLAGDAAP
ncbi:CMRF35-like molecule 7 [Pipistrellus kuhlii]|uniref:CD300 molecule like family member b n=1 Tax=Pipistrellus kuhlii TaxID=59472 RepID=A0A7J7SUD4_PIPKU|nr:CMRF35-like molecule 7 [Pipistrellus kuhlii]KAF6292069.1 CD300 molecule like family member b [Pipistrellus kuhlii]